MQTAKTDQTAGMPTDQTGGGVWMPSLILDFTWRTCHFVGYKVAIIQLTLVISTSLISNNS